MPKDLLRITAALALIFSPIYGAAQNPLPPGFSRVLTTWKASPITADCSGFSDGSGRSWTDPLFDDSTWAAVTPPDIGTFNTPGLGPADRFYRGTFTLAAATQSVFLFFVSDDGIEIFVNGTGLGSFHPFSSNICHVLGCVNIPGCGPGFNLDVTPVQVPANLLRSGTNVIAAHVSNGGGGSYFDMAVLTAPTPRAWLGGAALGSTLYAVGGGTCPNCTEFGGNETGTTDFYDASTNVWSPKRPLGTARFALTASPLNGKIYAIGGTAGSSSLPSPAIEEFDPTLNSWSAKSNMITPRWKATSSVVGGLIFAIGGGGTGNQCIPTNAVEAYDPLGDIWSVRTAMPTPRWGAASAAINSQIYVVGGSALCPHISVDPLATLEIYDPLGDTWTSRAPMTVARWDLAAAAVNGKLYAIGGWDPINQKVLATVEEYNPATNTWSAKATMPTARSGLVAMAIAGKIYVFGGTDNSKVLDTLEIYDPATDTWLNPQIGQGSGTISVSTNNAAATFTITDGIHTFNGSGTAFTQTAPAGKYAITFDPIASFITPRPQTKILNSNSKIEFSAAYLQHIVVSPSALEFEYPQRVAGIIPQQEMSIQTSATPIPLSISTSTETGGNWLSISATNPTTPANLLVGVSSGLPQGQYRGAVHIHAFGAVESNDLTVPITLIVGPAAAVQINIELLDPAPVVENMQIVSPDTAAHIALLSSPTLQPLEGAATDGVSKLLVRVSVSQPGNTVLFLTDSLGENSLPAEEAGNVPPDTLPTVGDNKVFAVYGAPDQFVRSLVPADANATQRQIYVRVVFIPSSGPTVRSELFPIILERPPIVLVHGLWSDESAWDDFPLTSSINCADSGKFYACRINYGPDAANSFAPIASEVGPLLRANIAQFRKDRHVAALQADVIAHSMGGDIVRTLPLCNGTVPACNFVYKTSANLGLGDVHRLITIGTPHLGTPVANDLVQHLNTRCCPYLTCFGRGPLFKDAFRAQTGHSLDAGAVQDLQEGSAAISTVQNSEAEFPMHFVVGIANSTDESLLDQGLVKSIRNQCSSSILPEHIRNLFNMDSDLLVSEKSQGNARSVISSPACVTRSLNLIHTNVLISPGQTGFSPQELGSANVGMDVLKLLDSPACFCK